MYRSVTLAVLSTVVWLAADDARAATPLEECAQSTAPAGCLDKMLRQVNLRLNAALKAAQARVEKLQKDGRRPVQNAFVNSQRQFNAYRDANCAWQAIGAPPSSSAEFIKDCQIRATQIRERELLAFARGEEDVPLEAQPTFSEDAMTEPASESAPIIAVPQASPPAEESPIAARSEPKVTARHGTEWRLVSWVEKGAQRELVPDSNITIAFAPTGKFAGNASLNSFSGTYRFRDDGGLEWSRGAYMLTKIVGPQPLMLQERAFLGTLRRMLHYRADGETLTLESADRGTVLTFAR